MILKSGWIGAQRAILCRLLALSKGVGVAVSSRVTAVAFRRALFVVSVVVSQAVGGLVARRFW